MIRFDIIGDRETIDRLSRVHSQVQRNVEATIGRLTLRLLARVKGDKLSGQVLKTRTGRLRRSINRRLEGAGTTSIAGYVGTNIEYARRHELGFHGTETVREHLRLIKQAWGKPLRSPKQVRVQAHSRQVDYPARSFLRTALREMGTEITANLKQATNQGVKR